jgi:hypothetical protein
MTEMWSSQRQATANLTAIAAYRYPVVKKGRFPGIIFRGLGLQFLILNGLHNREPHFF